MTTQTLGYRPAAAADRGSVRDAQPSGSALGAGVRMGRRLLWLFGRLFRISIALAILGVGIWAIGHKISTISSIDGVMDARLIVLRAPARGVVTASSPLAGDTLSAHQQLLSLQNTSADYDATQKLRFEIKAAQEQIKSLEQEAQTLEATDARFSAQALEYQQSSIRRSELKLAEAQTLEESARVTVARNKEEAERTTGLEKIKALSSSEASLARLDADVAVQKLKSAQDQVQRARVELDSAKQGIYLDDPSGTTPYAQQRVDEVRLRLTELSIKLTDQRTELARLTRMADYQDSAEKYKTLVSVRSPCDGVLWETLARTGSDVAEDQLLATVLDPRDMFAIAVIDGKYQKLCAPGAEVSVRFTGTRDWLKGTVRSVYGGSVHLDGETMAAQLPVAKSNATDGGKAIILVDVDGLPSDSNQRCSLIGRRLEVRLHRDGNNWHGFTDAFLPE